MNPWSDTDYPVKIISPYFPTWTIRISHTNCHTWDKPSSLSSLKHTMSLSKLQDMVKDREDRHTAVHGVAKSWTWLSDWTTTKEILERWINLSINQKILIPSHQFRQRAKQRQNTNRGPPTVLAHLPPLWAGLQGAALQDERMILHATWGPSQHAAAFPCQTLKPQGSF